MCHAIMCHTSGEHAVLVDSYFSECGRRDTIRMCHVIMCHTWPCDRYSSMLRDEILMCHTSGERARVGAE